MAKKHPPRPPKHEPNESAWRDETAQARLAAIVEFSDDAIISKDLNSVINSWNNGAEKIFGYSAKEMVGTSILRLIPADRRDEEIQILEKIKRGEHVVHFETLRQTKSGRLIQVSVTVSPIRDATGKIIGASKVAREITERKQAEQALRASEDRLRIVTEHARVGLVIVNPERRYIFANSSYSEILGLPSASIIGQRVADVLGNLYEGKIGPNLDCAFAGERVSHELKKPTPGSDRFYAVRYEPIKVDEVVSLVVIVITDITELKRGELRIQRLNRVYALLSDINQTIVRERDPQSMLAMACRIAVEKGQFRMAWIGLLDGKSTMRLAAHAGLTSDYLERVQAALASNFSEHSPTAEAVRSGEHVIINDIEHDPRKVSWRASAMPLGFRASAAFPIRAGDQITGSFNLYSDEVGFFDEEETRLLDELVMDVGFALDISHREAQRVRTEEELRESEERFRQLAENIDEVFWISTPGNSRLLYVSPSYEKIWGRSCESLYNSSAIWFDAIYSEDRERIREAAMTKQNCGKYDETYRIVRPDGSLRWIRDRAFPLRNAAGDVFRVVGTAMDISVSQRLEQQLRQAQKMEAIGQLAGGVAHDFNNLLTVINGRSQLMMSRFKPGEKMRNDLELIYTTGERAASLTRQLLAFSRQQVLEAVVLDLNAVTADMDKMLRRLIREDIDLTTVLDPSLKRVKADPGQIEQVIINLVVNARDAMTDGGKITIETTNVELDEVYCRAHSDSKPGRYVMLAVSDTGQGMDAKVKARIFEPFFTTKAQGKGTGLGLATVFGVVAQSNGHIEVYSEVGRGTTFKVYLPQTQERPASIATESQLTTPVGQEVILIVEDEEGVRELVRDLLEMNGYTVLSASNGVEALKLCEEYKGAIHLLVTDVVMPEMGGPELAERMKLLHPETKTLFTSGYTDRAIVRNGALEAGVAFIQKPFTPANLARKVRDILDKA